MKDITTKDLTNELTNREGIQSINVEPYQEIIIKTGQEEINLTGPARILINID